MKKQIKIVLPLLIIVLIVIILIYNNVNSLNNKNRLINKSYAIYVKENNSSSYTNANNIPKGSYVLNEEKSFCENNGKIYEYDNVNGYVTYKTKGSDKCTLYFDYDGVPTISNVSVSNNTITATFSDDVNLLGYAITTTLDEPTTWTSISGKTYSLNITLDVYGKYYLWVKDSAGNIVKYENVIDTRKSFLEQILLDNPVVLTQTTVSENTEDTTGKIYKQESTSSSFMTEDINGDGIGETVYYYSGNPQKNWVKFGKWETDWYRCDNEYGGVTYESVCISDDESTTTATKIVNSGSDMYWRIIRSNEDGSIRLLYSGTSPDATSASIGRGYGWEIGDSSYSAYWAIGYMSGGTNSLENSRKNSSNSGTKQKIDNWYEKMLLKNYDKYISKTAIYCNDRSQYSSDTLGGYARQWWQNIGTPTFKCGGNPKNTSTGLIETTQAVDDKFSVSTSSGGNGKLKYGIALMTADEYLYMGGLPMGTTRTFSKYAWYYYNSVGTLIQDEWWTMTPASTDTYAKMFMIVVGDNYNTSHIDDISIRYVGGDIRPVISLKSCVKYESGDGSASNPYIVNIDDECAKAEN